MVAPLGIVMVPPSGLSSPVTIFKREDFPVPLTPIKPILSSSLMVKETSLNKVFHHNFYIYFQQLL